MKFTVKVSDGTSATFEGTYELVGGGALVVLPYEAHGRRVVFGPAGWHALEVEEQED